MTAADLIDANLTAADLTSANLIDTNLTGASADRATVWPDGFDWQAAGVRMATTPDAAAADTGTAK